MKTCSTCHVDKDESEYYARTRKCKECTKASVRANRLANLEYYQNYDRNRPNKDERVKKSIEYNRTEKGKEVRRKATKKYRLNSIKYAAHNYLVLLSFHTLLHCLKKESREKYVARKEYDQRYKGN